MSPTDLACCNPPTLLKLISSGRHSCPTPEARRRFNEPFAVSPNKRMLGHAWLSLRDKHTTTGRINLDCSQRDSYAVRTRTLAPVSSRVRRTGRQSAVHRRVGNYKDQQYTKSY